MLDIINTYLDLTQLGIKEDLLKTAYRKNTGYLIEIFNAEKLDELSIEDSIIVLNIDNTKIYTFAYACKCYKNDDDTWTVPSSEFPITNNKYPDLLVTKEALCPCQDFMYTMMNLEDAYKKPKEGERMYNKEFVEGPIKAVWKGEYNYYG